jgi:hypothetical protein
MMKISKEAAKYLIRFGMIALIAIPILIWSQGLTSVKIVAYKTCLVAGGIGFAEMIWATWFRPSLGKMENYDNAKGIFLFRGLLYASIILAFTLGL